MNKTLTDLPEGDNQNHMEPLTSEQILKILSRYMVQIEATDGQYVARYIELGYTARGVGHTEEEAVNALIDLCLDTLADLPEDQWPKPGYHITPTHRKKGVAGAHPVGCYLIAEWDLSLPPQPPRFTPNPLQVYSGPRTTPPGSPGKVPATDEAQRFREKRIRLEKQLREWKERDCE